MSRTPRSNWLLRPPTSPMHHKVLRSALHCKTPDDARRQDSEGAEAAAPLVLLDPRLFSR